MKTLGTYTTNCNLVVNMVYKQLVKELNQYKTGDNIKLWITIYVTVIRINKIYLLLFW